MPNSSREHWEGYSALYIFSEYSYFFNVTVNYMQMATCTTCYRLHVHPVLTADDGRVFRSWVVCIICCLFVYLNNLVCFRVRIPFFFSVVFI